MTTAVSRAVTWDPFGTLGNALWIGGGQWAGKSTVSNILAHRYGLTVYHYDYHQARAHWDRRCAAAARDGAVIEPPTAEEMFVATTPEVSALQTVAALEETFPYVLDDLRALVSGRPIVIEGFVARPDLVLPIARDPHRMLLMMPTDAWRLHQSRTLERAMRPSGEVSDLVTAQRNRLERDRLVAASAVAQARHAGVRVLEIDGTVDAEGIADVVADHFARFLAGSRSRD